MTTTPGFPLITVPAVSVPVFTAATVAVDATVTSVTLKSTSAGAQSNVPFRFGQVFKRGAFAPGSFLAGKVTGQANLPLQVNVMATWQDGSVRHAVVSGVLPSLTAGATVTMDLVRASAGPSTVAIAAANFLGVGFSARAVLTFGGTDYTADAGPAIAALAQASSRVPGAVSTEYNVVLAPKTGAGVAHPDIEVRFDVIYFPGANAFKVDATFEHTKAFSTTGDLTYSASILVNGVAVYTLPAPLTHYPHARWHQAFWIGNQYPVSVQQNRDYLIDSKAVANYDRSVTIAESLLATYATQVNDASMHGPMKNGIFRKQMGAVGGRPDIGLLHAPAAAAVLSMDPRAIAMAAKCGDVGGSWSMHYRDTSTGPGAGLPLSPVNWPYATAIVSAADTNPSTGQNELLTSPVSSSDMSAEDSHTPNFAYLPYLLTGDLYYLEEMQFWICGLMASKNYAARQKEKGIVQKSQTRAQGWLMRGIVENAAFCPDTHPLKSHFKYWVDSNIALYDAMYTNNPDATPLGCLDSITNDADRAYAHKDWNGVITGPAVGIGLFQDDFFTSAIGHAVELGYSAALPLLRWKAKFQVGRMLAGGGWCYLNACFQFLMIAPSYTAPTFTTLAECQAASVGTAPDGFGPFTQAISDAPCNSQARLDIVNATRVSVGGLANIELGEITGYARTAEGYPSNYQPGLAAAVDSGYTDGDLAWSLFAGRSAKPDYGLEPQFAIAPRSVSTDTTPTDPQPTIRKAMSFDRVKTTTSTTGTGIITVSASPAMRYLPLSSIPIGTSVALVIEDENGTDWEESYCTILSDTTFSRDTVIKGKNGQIKVNFSAGTKTVFATLTADQINAFLTAASITGAAVATSVSNPATTSLVMNDSGAIKQITAANFFASVGKGPSTLSTIAPTTSLKALVFDPSTGQMSLSLLSDILALAPATSTPAAVAPGQVTGLTAGATTDTTQVLSWTAPSTGTAPFTYKVERSVAGANSWTVAAAAASASPYTVTSLTASTSYDYRVSATNTAGTGTPSAIATKSTTATPATPVQTITVNTPATQMVGVAFNVAGSYTNGTPTALDYRLSDDTAGAWAQVATATISGGNFSFSVTPASASAGRTITVRDRTTQVSGTSGTYVVNAAAGAGAPTPIAYQFNGNKFAANTPPANLSFGGNDSVGTSGDFILKTAGGAAPDDATMDVYVTFATSSTVMPRPNDAQHANPPNGSTWVAATRIGPGQSAFDGCYNYTVYTYKSLGGAGTLPRYVWMLVFEKGANTATATPIFAGPYDGMHTGTPVMITMGA